MKEYGKIWIKKIKNHVFQILIFDLCTVRPFGFSVLLELVLPKACSTAGAATYAQRLYSCAVICECHFMPTVELLWLLTEVCWSVLKTSHPQTNSTSPYMHKEVGCCKITNFPQRQHYLTNLHFRKKMFPEWSQRCRRHCCALWARLMDVASYQ